MSDSSEKVVVSDPEASLNPPESKQEESGAEFVKRKAYEEVARDMHKYKANLKEAQAALSEYDAKLKSIEEEKLIEEKRWEELYKKEKDEKAQIQRMSHESQEKFNRAVKMSQLKAELGGNIKDAYLQFANLNEIELLDDGTIDPDSIHKVANEFRNSYPELIPSNNKSKITNTASSPFGYAPAEKSLNEMSFEEKAELLKQLKNRS